MSDRDPMIGLEVKGFVIRSKLAEGGMGAVYLAEHERFANIKKVIKVLLAEYSRNTVVRQRFEREAEAAARLHHDHIIKIDNFGTLPDGQLFLMMPFLDGKSLDVHIHQNGSLDLHHTLHIMVQVFSALQHLHDAGIVHRDLKPGNIFLSETAGNPYTVTLIDLGIARDVAADAAPFRTQTGTAIGTPGYMAVEQYGNAASASAAADLYAAAIIIWEMLTGQMPWGVHDSRVLYHLQMTERPEPPADPSISANLLALLLRAFSVSPADRPPSARAFAVGFASLVPAVPPHVPSGAEILQRFARKLVERAAPHLETVRIASEPDRDQPTLWPYRATQLPHLPNEVPITPVRAATPIAPPPTVNERVAPRTPIAPPQTTLSGSSGVTFPPERNRLRGRFVIAGVACAALTAIVTFALVRTGSRSSNAKSPAVASDAGIVDLTIRDAGIEQPRATVPSDASASAAESTATKDPSPDAGALIPVDAPRSTKSQSGGTKSTDIRRVAIPPDAGAHRGSGTSLDPEAVEE